MVKVINLKVSELNFAKEKSADFKKCLALVPDLLKYLPSQIKFKVSFELKDTNSQFANAIRRCLINEVKVVAFEYNEKDVFTDDQFILSDVLKRQIELLPINQDLDYAGIVISVDKANKGDGIIDVYAGDFVAKKAGKEIDISKIVNPLAVITRLRPECYLKILNIHVKEGIGRTDAGAFSNISNITYKPLDVVPLDLEAGTGKSSLITNASHFLIGYATHRNTAAPLNILKKACETLIGRLHKILEDFKNIKDKDDYYYSDFIQMETVKNVKEIQFKNESWTLVNAIARYCYELTEGHVKFITTARQHPEKEIAILKIAHIEFSKLTQKAIGKFIDELKIVHG